MSALHDLGLVGTITEDDDVPVVSESSDSEPEVRETLQNTFRCT